MSSPSLNTLPKRSFTLSTTGSTAEPLYQVKLLSALRSGDPALIHPFLADISRERRASKDGLESDLGAAALHLAIRCGSADTVAFLLTHRSISCNAVHPPGSGTTALHLAASLGRADVVNILLEQEDIDDTLRNSNGKTCKEVARGKETIKAINDSRSFVTASYRSLLRTYIHSPPPSPAPPALIALLSSPRVHVLDLSYIDDESGTTLLHEAARRKDLSLIELAVRGGADVFVRDRRGRTVTSVAGKDDKVRVFLRQFTNQDMTLLDEKRPKEQIELKGYLNKYTNVARGYNTRWFVLSDGVLSYYRHQDDESISSRGSIAMKNCVLRIAQGDKLRFEVHSTPSRGSSHTAIQKWYLKAAHPMEATRWTTAISREIDHYKHLNQVEGSESETPSLSQSSSIRGSISRVPTMFKQKYGTAKMNADSSVTSLTDTEGDSSIGGRKNGSPQGEKPLHGHETSRETGYEAEDADGEDEDDEYGADESTKSKDPPHTDTFELQANSLSAQLEVTANLLRHTDDQSDQAKAALKESLSTVQNMATEYIQMVTDREAWWKARVKKEQEKQSFWEDSLASVVREGEALEQALKQQVRSSGIKKRSRIFAEGSVGDGMGTIKQRPAGLPVVLSSPGLIDSEGASTPQAHKGGASSPVDESIPAPQQALPPSTQSTLESSQEHSTPTVATSHAATLSISPSHRFSLSVAPVLSPSRTITNITDAGDEDEVDTDEEDEFFDAIESGTLPNLVVNESLEHHNSAASKSLSVQKWQEQYVGYKKLREKLAMNSDNRPPTSLWSVLKHSIGKDLTKISFPVFFNEPTSMLQRMAEDMEFSECLDAATAEHDPLLRIAFISAFAMSNYSSTIGRIAKPFNPMLGETFEYVRLDKEYRYFSEQVSHHPPISACYADAPKWRYYGEVDAQNKFMGKSFEIRPTGVAHVDLLFPPSSDVKAKLPATTDSSGEEKLVEHYSWKKVTTNVSGFILGSPTIDHYGEMIITNHRTQDTCTLTFKPRGWRGKDAFEISGRVADAQGNIHYEIAGRWNSQLVARKVLGSSINPANALSPDANAAESKYILLWRNSEKPPAPFNLTPFAITLNDCSEETLKPYICPTDCRLRPDQRAFELCRYEHANDLKTKQEEKQRATRKLREEGKMPKHNPRWFVAETEVDTGERVWRPNMEGITPEYWTEREKVWKGQSQWESVEHIFIDDEP